MGTPEQRGTISLQYFKTVLSHLHHSCSSYLCVSSVFFPPVSPPQRRVEHIVGNLLMQLLLGIPLELVHKGFEVGMVYLAGVLAGERSHCSSWMWLKWFFSDFYEPGLSKYETVPCFPSGSLCSSIFDPLSALVGASGGVYALIGGYFMNAVVVRCLLYFCYY